jgi:hypothetical protein
MVNSRRAFGFALAAIVLQLGFLYWGLLSGCLPKMSGVWLRRCAGGNRVIDWHTLALPDYLKRAIMHGRPELSMIHPVAELIQPHRRRLSKLRVHDIRSGGSGERFV